MLAAQRTQQRKQTKKWLAVLVTLLLGAAGTAWLGLRAMPVPLDAKNCPPAGPLGLTAIVLDATDPIDAIGTTDLRRRLHTYLTDSVREGEGVQIWRVAGARGPEHAETEVICKPPAAASALTSSHRLTQERYDAHYLQPLQAAIETALASPQEKTSPILETVQRAVLAFASMADADHRSKRIVLASDLCQNTTFSLEWGDRDFRRFQRSPQYVRLAPRGLDGISVLVYRIARHRQYGHASELEAFWRALIEANHGTVTAIEPIVGES
jgi:hypothetical protein